jgi:HEAT repeat protein
MRLVVISLLTLCLFGCGKPKSSLSGGKPASYWIQAVSDPDPHVRKTAVFKLGNVGSSEAEALPAVTAALKDPDALVRREAILALVKFGAEAKEATATLTQMRRLDRDARVRNYAAAALERIKD